MFTVTTGEEVEVTCPPSYKAVGNACILTSENRLNFRDAQSFCYQQHGIMAKLDDCEKFSDVLNYLEGKILNSYSENWRPLTVCFP